jgi:hypothetical protein
LSFLFVTAAACEYRQGPQGPAPMQQPPPQPTMTAPPSGTQLPPGPTATYPTATSTAPVALPNVPPAPAKEPPGTKRWEGLWSSASCGPRTYERRIDLNPSGTFSAQDRVSPCPPKAQCVWSGIVERKGTWKAEGDAIVLTAEAPSKPAGQPLPGRLTWNATAAAPSEDGTPACTYAHPKD